MLEHSGRSDIYQIKYIKYKIEVRKKNILVNVGKSLYVSYNLSAIYFWQCSDAILSPI